MHLPHLAVRIYRIFLKSIRENKHCIYPARSEAAPLHPCCEEREPGRLRRALSGSRLRSSLWKALGWTRLETLPVGEQGGDSGCRGRAGTGVEGLSPRCTPGCCTPSCCASAPPEPPEPSKPPEPSVPEASSAPQHSQHLQNPSTPSTLSIPVSPAPPTPPAAPAPP